MAIICALGIIAILLAPSTEARSLRNKQQEYKIEAHDISKREAQQCSIMNLHTAHGQPIVLDEDGELAVNDSLGAKPIGFKISKFTSDPPVFASNMYEILTFESELGSAVFDKLLWSEDIGQIQLHEPMTLQQRKSSEGYWGQDHWRIIQEDGFSRIHPYDVYDSDDIFLYVDPDTRKIIPKEFSNSQSFPFKVEKPTSSFRFSLDDRCL